MPINADKPQRWKEDIARSVDLFNDWFMKFAPKAYWDSRTETTKDVEQALVFSKDLTQLTGDILQANPGILPTLRMSCCPPLARDRLIGLASVSISLVKTMELSAIPPRMRLDALKRDLAGIIGIITRMLDGDIFPWLSAKKSPTELERHRASPLSSS